MRDERLKKLVNHIIDSCDKNGDYLEAYGYDCLTPDPVKSGRGVTIGNQTSQICGMFYLNKVD